MKNIVSLVCLFITISCLGQGYTKKYFKSNKTGKIYTELEYEVLKEKKSEDLKKYNDLILKETIVKIKESKDSLISYFDLGFTINIEAKKRKEKENINSLLGSGFDFEALNIITNNDLNLKALENKPTFVSFWFVACKPCVEEIPVLNALKDQFYNSVNFIAVTFDSKEKLDTFLLKRNFNFTHVSGAMSFIKSMSINVYPKNLIIDKKGIIKKVYSNIIEESDELEKVKGVLKSLM